MSDRIGALYIRVSTDDQAELSPDAQKRLLLDYAKKNGIIISNDFIFSESVSGRHVQKRPEFQRMIGIAKQPSHPIDVILVWKYSRFARNQEESIVYKSMLKKDHVEVISVSEPLIDGPFGSLIERIIEWMDEYYSIRLSEEVLRGMKEKALRNGYQSSPCLGYEAVGHGKPYQINEAEYAMVSYIMDLYDNHNMDETAIARKCNDLGYKTKRGNPFERRTIDRILQNPFYCGIVSWNGVEFEGAHEGPECFHMQALVIRIAEMFCLWCYPLLHRQRQVSILPMLEICKGISQNFCRAVCKKSRRSCDRIF